MRITLIHNPGAGAQGQSDRKLLVRLLEEAGHQVLYQSSKDEGWKSALKAPADAIAIAGGDGTIGKVARRMAGKGVPLAPLPCGTANNLSRTLGLVDRPLEVLIDSWKNPRRVRLDVGTAKGPWKTRTFIEGVGLGVFADLLAGPRRKRDKSVAPDDRLVSGLERLRKLAEQREATPIQARLDGKDISGRYLLFEAMNIPYIGPSLYLAPESQPGDGSFDVVLVTEAERERLIAYLDSWKTNRERIAVLPSHRGRHLEVQWDGFDVHIDDKRKPKPGDVPKKGGTSIDVRLDGLSVEFLCPPKEPD